MELNYENFWQEYPHIVEMLFPPLTPKDGVAEIFIVEAERKLGFSLPPLLREFYQKVGSRQDINEALHHLINPKNITLKDGKYLAFYEENQGVYCWVISYEDIEKPNPPVATYFNSKNISPTFSQLSTFLGFLLLEQAIAQSPCWGSYGEASVREVQNCTQDWLCFQGDNHFGAVKHKAAIHLHPTDETAKGRLEVGCHLVGDALRLREIPGMEFEDVPAEWPEADELW